MRKLVLILPLLAFSVGGCGDDSSSKGDMTVVTTHDMAVGTGDMTTPGDAAMPPGDMAGIPAAPSLGAQIDRMGRAGVNTALTDPFWDDGTQTAATHHAKQDAYNAISDPTMWGTSTLVTTTGAQTISTIIGNNLGVYDALDGTTDGLMTGTGGATDGCGNQFAYGSLGNAKYATLTSVLVDDQLYVNAGSGTCSTYLAVEANVVGVTNTDCGGRTPNYNTIDITYSALTSTAAVSATGCLSSTATCPVTNGVTSDPDATPANITTFPFLGAPN